MRHCLVCALNLSKARFDRLSAHEFCTVTSQPGAADNTYDVSNACTTT